MTDTLYPFDVFSSECGHIIVYGKDIIGAAVKAHSVNPKLTRNKIESIRKLRADQIQIIGYDISATQEHVKYTPEDLLKDKE